MANFDTRKRDVKIDTSQGAVDINVSNNTMYSDVRITATATSVGYDTITTILTHTATAVEHVTQISCSGQTPAKYQVFINTGLVDTKRSKDYNADFSFLHPLRLGVGDIIDIKVTHKFNGGSTFDYDTTLYAFQP